MVNVTVEDFYHLLTSTSFLTFIIMRFKTTCRVNLILCCLTPLPSLAIYTEWSYIGRARNDAFGYDCRELIEREGKVKDRCVQPDGNREPFFRGKTGREQNLRTGQFH